MEPKLQPPGAGLPLLQRLFIRLIAGPILSKVNTPAENRIRYERLVQKIIELVSSVPVEKRSLKVLVDPIPGLEDSSRYWSLNEVLEHLLIVSKRMEFVILELSAGRIPQGEADTANVKPSHPDQSSLPEFVEYAPNLMKRIDQRIIEKLDDSKFNFDSALKYRHPWFGEITAKQWYWLLAGHHAIHLGQAKAVLKKLDIKKLEQT